MTGSKNFTVYENLDTAFVSLGALLRYLQQRGFTGRVQIDMGDYTAEVRLREGVRTFCRERDRATGREAEGDAALQRLLVRSTDAGGLINVYREEGQDALAEPTTTTQQQTQASGAHEETGRVDEEVDWQGLLRASADLIAAVERAALSTGADFDAMFRAARLELADDYSFLDPNAGRFEYANNEIELHTDTGGRAFVSGLCETLRRVVERLTVGHRSASVRERVALELAVLARRRARQLKEFGILPQLDRIAGTRVI